MPKPEKQPAKAIVEKQDWRIRFIEVFRDTANVRLAAHAAGVQRDTVYKAKRKNVAFARAWKEAEEDACDLLEAEARKRAKNGSDTLLIFLLKAHRPEKYADRLNLHLLIKQAAKVIRDADSSDLLAVLGYNGPAPADPEPAP